MGVWGGILDRVAGWLGYARASAVGMATSAPSRHAVYRINEALYDNQVYEPRQFGGCLEDVLLYYFGRSDSRNAALTGHFNPVREIVEVYQNVLPGTWGDGLRPAPEVDNKPINPKLAGPLTTVWRDGNFDTEKGTLARWAANLGTAGLRPVYNADSARVSVRVDHPGRIWDVEEDADGNVTAVVLRYAMPLNRGTALEPRFESVEVVEQINRDDFSRTYNGQEQLPDDQRANRFGFCPYVVLRHKDNGTLFGDWAYKGAERQIHSINYRITRQDKSIDRHQFPNWFGTAGGPPPKMVDLGTEKIAYVQSVAGTPPPSLEAIVAKIDQKASTDFWMGLRDLLRGRQPELNLNDVRLLAGVSGETLAQVLKPTEAAVLSVRPAYDHAVIRAYQMAVSVGCELGLWDVGTGTGAEAGDRAWAQGLLRWAFAPRPAIPQTVIQQTQQVAAAHADKTAKADLARKLDGVASNREQLIVAGYTPGDADRIIREKAQQDAIVTTGDGTGGGTNGTADGQFGAGAGRAAGASGG